MLLKRVLSIVGAVNARAAEAPLCVVTGGAGFFGRGLVRRLLDEGWRVRVVDLQSHSDLDPRAELWLGDFCDASLLPRALGGATVVFHTAALVELSGIARKATRARVLRVNVEGTRRLLQIASEQGVGRFVYTSSNNVVFDRAIDDGDEREPYAENAFDLYTRSKVAAEKLVLAAGKQGQLRTCALRPGGLWAPYSGGVMIDKLLDQLARGTFVARIGAGSRADNTHVDNLAEAHVLAARALLEKPQLVSGEAYFITDEEPMDPLEWMEPLLRELGYELPRLRVPASLMYMLGYASEVVHRYGGPRPLLTRLEVLKVTRPHTFRIDKARAHLGYEPLVKSREGLRACVPFARAYLARRGVRIAS